MSFWGIQWTGEQTAKELPYEIWKTPIEIFQGKKDAANTIFTWFSGLTHFLFSEMKEKSIAGNEPEIMTCSNVSRGHSKHCYVIRQSACKLM
jgi:hypothetical protein